MKTLEKQAPIWEGSKQLVRDQWEGPGQQGLGMPSKHLRGPWGWEEGRDRMISVWEGRSQGQGDTLQPTSHHPSGALSPQGPPVASGWPRQWAAMVGCQDQVEVQTGFLYAQTTVTPSPSPTPEFLLACQV